MFNSLEEAFIARYLTAYRPARRELSQTPQARIVGGADVSGK